MDRRSHAVGAELDSDSWRSKRLERAVAVGAGLKPTPGRGLPMGEYSGCLLSHVICAGVRLLMELRVGATLELK